MRKNILIVLVLLLIFADTISQVSHFQIDEAMYELVFHDEFSQRNGSQPDIAAWSCPPWSNARWSRWISDSSAVAFIKNGMPRGSGRSTIPCLSSSTQSVGMGGYDYFMPQTNKVYETQFDWVRVYQRKP